MNRFLSVVWDANPVAFSLFGLEIRWYGIFWALAFILGIYFFTNFVRREKLPEKLVDSLFWYATILGILGARLGHCLFYDADYYLAHPLEIAIPIVKTASGWKFIGYAGLASHGATVGIITSLWLYARRYNFSLWDLWDKIER